MNKLLAVIGCGYMGGGIAQVLAAGGFKVNIWDADQKKTQLARERLIEESQQFADSGLTGPAFAESVEANIRAASSLGDAVADVAFVEEAVFEDLSLKRSVLASISEAAPEDAVIGTNTSTIQAAHLYSAVKNPRRFLTVHFSNPAPFIPGVELVKCPETDEGAVEFAETILVQCGKLSARVADVPGMVINRLQYLLLTEAFRLVDEGVVSAEDVDLITRTTFGYRLGHFGPFSVADQAGLDTYVKGYEILRSAYGDRFETPIELERTVSSGHFGVKSGRGFLGEYNDEREASLVEYRNRAYAQMSQFQASLGERPE